MARITVILDEIIKLSQNNGNNEPNPAKAAALCELAGASGAAIQVRDGNITSYYERAIKSIKDVLGIPLALLIPARDNTIEKVIDLKPDMAVLCDCLPGDEDKVSRLQVSNIITAIEITPEIDRVKASAKMKADYVVIDSASFCKERNLSARVDLLNDISKAAALAERLSIGVIISGPIVQADLAKLSQIEQVEDFFIGHEVISKAVLFGFRDALSELKSEINRY